MKAGYIFLAYILIIIFSGIIYILAIIGFIALLKAIE